VKKATVEFNASARMDDRLEIGLKCSRVGNSSITFMGGIFRADELLVTCELVYVFADPASMTSRPVPAALRDVLTGYEAGEAMAQVRTGSWKQLGEAAAVIRTEVFVNEQRIPKELEWDDDDAIALHAVASNRLGQAVATGRLLPSTDGVAKIGRMAVQRVLRGCGLGEQVLDTLMAAARERGDREIVLHAQRSAEGFYAALGYRPRGEPFDEAGIGHIEMTMALA
jgi:predicted GNAT family N-acyltransferase